MFIGDACLEIAVPTPGPLDYDPKLQPSGVQYSILGKHATAKEERTNIGPGPAKYDVRGIRLPYSDTPHWSFGHKFPEQKVKDDTPSPFAYNDTHNTFGKNNLSYTISGRFSGSESETPGPDRYFPKAEFGPTGTMPKYSFGLKPLLIDDPTPGPHDYDVPTDPPDAPCGPSFTMRRRLDESFRNKDTKPGPNQYYPKIPASEKMASLKGMHKENKSLKTPGPANYIIPANLFSGPHYTLTARNIPFQDYNPDAHLTLNKAPTFSLDESDNIPGPGAYHPRDRQIRGNGNPKVTIKGRHKSHIDKTPGPADYNSHVPAVNPTAAQLARNEAGRPMGVDQTPGPNAYYALPKKNGGSTTMKSRASPFVMVFPTNRVDTLRV
nr:hypothetical protein HK105_005527 [Polyrhizophydium stewartii]